MSQQWLAFMGAVCFGGFLATLGFVAIHLQEKDRRKDRENAPTPPPSHP